MGDTTTHETTTMFLEVTAAVSGVGGGPLMHFSRDAQGSLHFVFRGGEKTDTFQRKSKCLSVEVQVKSAITASPSPGGQRHHGAV